MFWYIDLVWLSGSCLCVFIWDGWLIAASVSPLLSLDEVLGFSITFCFPRKLAKHLTLKAEFFWMRNWVFFASSAIAIQQWVASSDICNNEERSLANRYRKCWWIINGPFANSCYSSGTLIWYWSRPLAACSLRLLPWTAWFLLFHMELVQVHIKEMKHDISIAGLGCFWGMCSIS